MKKQISASRESKVVALIYARVSSFKQKSEGHGLDSQEHRCRQYAESLDWTVIEEGVFRDDITGGGDFMLRPAMGKLLKYIDDNPHIRFGVIFDDLSRLARDVVQHVRLRTEFSKREVEIRCPNFNFDDTPEGELVEIILAAQNQFHRKSNKRQVIDKQKAMLEMGGYPFGGRRIGYDSVKDPITGRKVRTPNHLSQIVIEGLEGFAYKRFPNRIALARFWKEHKVFGKQSAEQCLGSVQKMLTDVFFAGYVEYEPWDVSRRLGWHKGLISLEVFDLNQKRLNAETSGKRIRHINNPDFELCGLVACSACKSSLRAYWSKGRKGKKYAYYECKNKQCLLSGKTIPRDSIEDDFKSLVSKYQPKKGLTEVATAMFEDVWKDSFSDLGKEHSITNKQIKSLREDISQLSDKLAKAPFGSILEEELSRRVEEKATERKLLEDKLGAKTDPAISYRTAVDKVMGAIKSPMKLWTSATIEQKKQLFYFFFDERLEYEQKKSYRTAQMSPILRLFERNDSSDSVYVEMGVIETPSELGIPDESTVCSFSFDLK